MDKKGFSSILEPKIPTAAGIRRPDLIRWKGDEAYVIDTTICADAHATRMEVVYQLKVNYYSNEDIDSWVRRTPGTAMVMNCREDNTRLTR